MSNLYENKNFFLPGEMLGEIEEVKKKYCLTDVKLGPGLILKSTKIYTTLCGFLTSNNSTTIWLVNSSRIYVPKLNDFVIGKIVKVRNDEYKVDLGNSIIARLSAVAFPNATKKVRPELKVGDSVYAKVCQANPNIDYEVTCCDSLPTNSTFGPLSSYDSYLISISIPLAHRFWCLIMLDC
ncbi:hypothetical protein MXB_3553 [Myxobolus squamalis]|nr:hypothetical protein MXB_3553 [Myxobolus squamalis]